MKEDPITQVTIDNFKMFKNKYYTAAKTGKKTFVFEGQDVSVQYAKYVLDYFYGKKL